jgi:hypothetical protein
VNNYRLKDQELITDREAGILLMAQGSIQVGPLII